MHDTGQAAIPGGSQGFEIQISSRAIFFQFSPKQDEVRGAQEGHEKDAGKFDGLCKCSCLLSLPLSILLVCISKFRLLLLASNPAGLHSFSSVVSEAE